MKNKLRIITIILLCCVLLSNLSFLYSCKKDDGGDDTNGDGQAVHGGGLGASVNTSFTSKQIVDAVIAAFTESELPDIRMDYFFSGASEDSDNYITEGRAGNEFHGRPDPVVEFAYLEDFALFMPSGQSIFEVSVMKVSGDQSDNTGAVKAILEKRMGRVSLGQLLNYAAH
ncbi:MAG: hypothetical protein FWD23_15550 [Oscillospiraceae bacterium]|nr:hypothetical protein [Oscillospiraceae bacterium]